MSVAVGEDDDVAFGRFLLTEGRIDADQARESYRLLCGYRVQHPQVNLAQVLAKHGMCDKETLRVAFQRFQAQKGNGGPPAAGPAPGSVQGDRFGFKTVELDPGPGPAPGRAPDAAGATPLVIGGAGWVETDTLVDRAGARPSAPPGFPAAVPFAPGFAPPSGSAFGPGPSPASGTGFAAPVRPTGPHGTHAGPPSHGSQPGSFGPRGTHAGPPSHGSQPGSFGPRGTHAGAASHGTQAGRAPFGPGATHRQPSASAPGASGGKVKLPGPLQLKPDDGADDEEDGDEHEDTNVQSTTIPRKKGARGRAQPAPAQKGPPAAVLAGAAAALVILVVAGLYVFLDRRSTSRARVAFLELAAASKDDPKAALEAVDTLPPKLLQDPEVKKEIDALRAAVAARDARAAAKAILAKLPEAPTLDARMALCTQAVEADPTFADAYVARARARYAVARRGALSGKAAPKPGALTIEAMSDLDQAISCDGRSALAHLAKGQLYLVQRGDPEARERAQSSLQNASTSDPEGPLGFLALGLIEAARLKLDEAIALFGKAIDRDPKLADAYLSRAEARLRKRDWANALNDASQAFRLDPTSAEALTLQAEARYRSSADPAGALADLDRATKIDPTHAAALALRSHVRLVRDRIGEVISGPDDQKAARDDAEAALRVDPEQPLAYLTLAEVCQAEGNTADALRYASRAVDKGRHLPLTFLTRGRLRARDADDQALADFEQVLEIEPNNVRALTMKGAILVARNELDNARNYLEQAITIDADLAEPYFQLGQCFLKQPRRELAKAIEQFTEAINRKPNFPDALFYRAATFCTMSRWEECLADLEKAEAQRKSGGFFREYDVWLIRGHCYYHMKDWANAKKWYEKYRSGTSVGAAALQQKVMPRLEELERRLAGQLKDDEPGADKGEDLDPLGGPGGRRRGN